MFEDQGCAGSWATSVITDPMSYQMTLAIDAAVQVRRSVIGTVKLRVRATSKAVYPPKRGVMRRLGA